MSERDYLSLALANPDVPWELHDGRLREKPPMSAEHNALMFELGYHLRRQLDPMRFRLRFNAGRLRRPSTATYIPDVVVIPAALEHEQRRGPGALELYSEPLPLVVEVWSPSTGAYDVDAKFPEYQQRGDHEIWRLHPFERTLRAWRRQSDGSYIETVYHGGMIEPVALPGVTIDLDELFSLER